MAPIVISQSEILDALREAANREPFGPDDAFTTGELGKALYLSREITERHIRSLLTSGALENVRVPRRCMDGTVRQVSGYRIVKKKKKGRGV